ncbi:hypothetical protein SLEP1_g1913 [Rubroshorea leprosula]|uniref:Uncharacterized protein n=1 Tax=Rubroshorea leprosula TaxID=152421 RepID=A0AAV5HJT6_9ROSI|nr:hypothetical protein SLEP1_g1913 [Rubroshorea leprosula]
MGCGLLLEAYVAWWWLQECTRSPCVSNEGNGSGG